MDIQSNVPLSPLSTFGTGGPAKYFVQVKSANELKEAIGWAQSNLQKIHILGGGSNIVIPDLGINGLVIHLDNQGIDILEESTNQVTICVQAGENWDNFVLWSINKGLQGIECLSGIPGKVGASPVQNIGAYGQEVKDTIKEVEVLDISQNTLKTLTQAMCNFAYRTSVFKSNSNLIVVSVTFTLNKNQNPSIRYAQLQQELVNHPNPSLSDVRLAVLKLRKQKSMLLDPRDPNAKSTGSFFKNPIITSSQLETLQTQLGQNVPNWPQSGRYFKVPAAYIIEQSGFAKGYIYKNVGLSTNHALAIINRGQATSAEILEFATLIQDTVKNKFDISLEPEPVIFSYS